MTTTNDDDRGTTTYRIEALREVIVLMDDADADIHTMAWLPVGEIVMRDAAHSYDRDALVAWIGEQDEAPGLGRYRVIEQMSYGYSNWHFTEFDYAETRERDIKRVEYPPAEVRAGVDPAKAEALEVIADAASVSGTES